MHKGIARRGGDDELYKAFLICIYLYSFIQIHVIYHGYKPQCTALITHILLKHTSQIFENNSQNQLYYLNILIFSPICVYN